MFRRIEKITVDIVNTDRQFIPYGVPFQEVNMRIMQVSKQGKEFLGILNQ